MVESWAIDDAPAYQRQFRWNELRRSYLIEPVPSLFMASNRDGTWELFDGVQRLSTLGSLPVAACRSGPMDARRSRRRSYARQRHRECNEFVRARTQVHVVCHLTECAVHPSYQQSLGRPAAVLVEVMLPPSDFFDDGPCLPCIHHRALFDIHCNRQIPA